MRSEAPYVCPLADTAASQQHAHAMRQVIAPRALARARVPRVADLGHSAHLAVHLDERLLQQTGGSADRPTGQRKQRSNWGSKWVFRQ